MAQITLDVPEELAKRLEPIGPWLPTILEISLVGFKTMATETAAEVIQFLSAKRSFQEVLQYHASERSLERLRRLLALNQAGMLGPAEHVELEELQQIEHILILLKARIGRELKKAL